jgi:hypothetical protein
VIITDAGRIKRVRILLVYFASCRALEIYEERLMQFMTGARVMLYQMLTDWRCSSAKIHTHSRTRCICSVSMVIDRLFSKQFLSSYLHLNRLNSLFSSDFSLIYAWIFWKSKSIDTICSCSVKGWKISFCRHRPQIL